MVDRISGPKGPIQPPAVKKGEKGDRAKASDFSKIINAAETPVEKPKGVADSVKFNPRPPETPKTLAPPPPAVFYVKPESREEKVSRIKKAVDQGSYHVSSEEVADRLLKIARDPDMLRSFALKDDPAYQRAEAELLPKLDEDQKKRYLDLIKKVQGDGELDRNDRDFIRTIRDFLRDRQG